MRYPVYIPSKGRAETCLTPRFLERDGVPFRLVVEAPEAGAYAARFGADRVLVLPHVNQGLSASRNFIKAHARATGAERHWQIDDNIRSLRSWQDGHKRRCPSPPVFEHIEDFVDRWSNVAIAGLRHLANSNLSRPYSLNLQVYSCVLVTTETPFVWRKGPPEDTDYALQVLSAGLCTVLFNTFFIDKAATMTMRGGCTDAQYAGDGRLRNARELQRLWPGLGIGVSRRFGGPRMSLGHVWRKFNTKLEPRAA